MSTTGALLMGNTQTLVRYIGKIKSTTHFFERRDFQNTSNRRDI